MKSRRRGIIKSTMDLGLMESSYLTVRSRKLNSQETIDLRELRDKADVSKIARTMARRKQMDRSDQHDSLSESIGSTPVSDEEWLRRHALLSEVVLGKNRFLTHFQRFNLQPGTDQFWC